MGSTGITSERVIKAKFKDYLGGLSSNDQNAFVSDMKSSSGAVIDGQIAELDDIFDSVTASMNQLNTAITVQMGNTAIINGLSGTPAAPVAGSLKITLTADKAHYIATTEQMGLEARRLKRGITDLSVPVPASVNTLITQVGVLKTTINSIP